MAIMQFNVGIKAIIMHENKVLLVKDSNQDQWECPGGRVDDNESVDETLTRELHEELPGITNIHIKETLHARRLPGLPFGDYGLVLIWKYVEAEFPTGVHLSEEHTEYKWFTIEEALNDAREGIAEALKSYLKLK